jgi:uncharacterized DUF497 family protein
MYNYNNCVEGVRFECDEGKNLSNRRKYGVSFEEASQVFRDPLYVSVQDRVGSGELRWQTLGLVEELLLLTVAHTVVRALSKPMLPAAEMNVGSFDSAERLASRIVLLRSG